MEQLNNNQYDLETLEKLRISENNFFISRTTNPAMTNKIYLFNRDLKVYNKKTHYLTKECLIQTLPKITFNYAGNDLVFYERFVSQKVLFNSNFANLFENVFNENTKFKFRKNEFYFGKCLFKDLFLKNHLIVIYCDFKKPFKNNLLIKSVIKSKCNFILINI